MYLQFWKFPPDVLSFFRECTTISQEFTAVQWCILIYEIHQIKNTSCIQIRYKTSKFPLMILSIVLWNSTQNYLWENIFWASCVMKVWKLIPCRISPRYMPRVHNNCWEKQQSAHKRFSYKSTYLFKMCTTIFRHRYL